MASVTPRFLWQSFTRLSNTVITVSSEDLAFPRRWMLDPMKTLAWRTKIGWTIIAGFNDKIDFNLSGVKVATIAAGLYTTGAALATAVQTALAAAYGTGTWTVTYNTSTFKFTITHSITAFTLLPVTGANVATTAVTELGWFADTSSATSQTGDAVYQSKAYVKFDLGSEMLVNAVALAGLLPLTGTGKIRIQAHASDAWTSPSYNQVLTATSQRDDLLVHWVASQSFRWWRIVIDDPARTGGYVKIAVPYIGGYIQLSQPPKNKGARNFHQKFSKMQTGDSGGIFVDVRTPALNNGWDFEHVTDAERLSLLTMQTAIDMTPQFYAMDPQNAPTKIEYGGVSVGEFAHGHGGGALPAFWTTTIVTQQQLQ